MTRNQIEYWNFKETKRANKARERQQANELAEQRRHSGVTEQQTSKELGIKQGQLDESIRSNKRNEEIKTDTYYESKRHNWAEEQLAQRKNEIQQEYNVDRNNIDRLKAVTDNSSADAKSRLAAQQVRKLENDLELAWKNYELARDKGDAEIALHYAKTLESLSKSIKDLAGTLITGVGALK